MSSSNGLTDMSNLSKIPLTLRDRVQCHTEIKVFCVVFVRHHKCKSPLVGSHVTIAQHSNSVYSHCVINYVRR